MGVATRSDEVQHASSFIHSDYVTIFRTIAMNSPDPTLRAGAFSPEDDDNESPLGDGFDAPESSAPEELEDETGIDLTDASDLDADNVTADEEQARVVQAPD
ncbi:MAG: hypothetical protein JWQ41_2806 [Variovorax sp.]|nr:hypothetical protein [Variovorax sp.]